MLTMESKMIKTNVGRRNPRVYPARFWETEQEWADSMALDEPEMQFETLDINQRS